ncbi:hypothetical protein V5799_023403 [Amblyomma americanum]|uniref:Uncharacterized protein n=1 Tax=Amblyomma americanum TaxID=6943 RepID=A0AAQ4FJF2_AMBAM
MAATVLTAQKNSAPCLRFTFADDLALLREVNAQNPLKDAAQWKNILRNLNFTCGKPFTARALRGRLDLLGQFIANDRTNLRKSGTEEEYEEKEKLLQISDLAREFGYKCKSRKAQAAANKMFATGVHDNACAAAARVSPHHSDSYSTPSGTASDTPETASYVLQQMCDDTDVDDDYFTTDAENFQSAQQMPSANVATDVQEETEEEKGSQKQRAMKITSF